MGAWLPLVITVWMSDNIAFDYLGAFVGCFAPVGVDESCRLKGASLNVKAVLVTACKRSSGQGNVFTSVCHSVRGGGVSVRETPVR